MFQVLHTMKLYATNTYGDYAMQGAWSDGESLGPGPMAAFDGQGSGDDFYGNFWHPSHGWVNSTDGGRGHTFQDYQQQ